MIVVLGAGESGVGAALLAKSRAEAVFVSDNGKIGEGYKDELNKAGIPFEENGHTENKILSAKLIIKSPGIPSGIPLLNILKENGIPIVGEIEFASRYTDAKIVAITGSNGKTTTTKLTHHLMQSVGLDAVLGGNIGKSFARLLSKRNADFFVLELSSFQLDDTSAFRPDFAALLNITADHLDRYDYKLSNYAAAKWRIAKNMGPSDLLIINQDDDNIRENKPHNINAQIIKIPFQKWESDRILIDTVNNSHHFDLSKSPLEGKHNRFNTIVAIRLALACGADASRLEAGLETFVNEPHRMEKVAEIDGVTYVNDSKATNVEAVYYAFTSNEKSTVWVAGGIDKGNDYDILLPLIEGRVHTLICLGKDNEKLIAHFKNVVSNIEVCDTAEKAVRLAAGYAQTGDQVLLSPACSSFDLFKNYAARGDLFREAVLELKEERESERI